MSNTSATGGYLVPSSSSGLPGGLTLAQFIQTVLVGISGLPGELVRPKFQVKPPGALPIETNWIAFAVVINSPDANAFTMTRFDGSSFLQRMEGLEIQCSFFGPDAGEIASLVRDGFQLQQNVEALRAAKMGYAAIDPARRIPDLINERWVERYEQTLYLRREIQRVYPILSILSASGTIHTVLGNEEYLLNWQTPEET